MTIYFVAGEVSADNHGAALMRSLRVSDPKLKFIGRGGPQMQQVAGAQFKNWIGDAAVLGLWEVLRKYGYFREQFRKTLNEIQESKPDVVVLIDYPGFNLRLARALRRQSQRHKTIYYISPQVWAWNRGRIKKMARFIDLVLCIFPFEVDLYAASGLRAVFVGHPMIERLKTQRIDTHRDQNLIGLFPGSRSREVRKIFPVMIEAARLLLHSNPALHFRVAAASEELADEMRKMVRRFAPWAGSLASPSERASPKLTNGSSQTARNSKDRIPATQGATAWAAFDFRPDGSEAIIPCRRLSSVDPRKLSELTAFGGPMKKLRVGVVGVGHIGSNHARIYAEIPSAEFTAVYDVEPFRSRTIASKFGAAPAKSLDDFMAMVDAASVATPTNTHYDVARALLAKGKHVLIEKPITDNTAHATELAELAALNGLILQVGHVERFNPVLGALEKHLTHPRFIEAHRLCTVHRTQQLISGLCSI